jgi:uroporphyrin-3 C-methyltransferase
MGLTALLVAALAAGGGAWLWQRMSAILQQQAIMQERLGTVQRLEDNLHKVSDQNRQLASRLDRLTRQVNGQLSGLQSRQRPLDKTLHQVLDDIKRLDSQYKMLTARLARQGTPPSAADVINFQRLLEVGFLLRNAQATLVLTQDPKQAIRLLVLADEQLTAMNDPRWLPVRQAIAQDRAALESIPLADTAGIALRLSAMAQQAHAWPLQGSGLQGQDPETEADVAPENPPSHGLNWKILRHELIRLWKRSVLITRVDRNSLPWQPYLRERLALHLQLAASAAVRGDQRLFSGELDQCRQLLMALDTNSPPVSQALQDISGLKNVDLQPRLPDLHAPLERFLHILEEQQEEQPLRQDSLPQGGVSMNHLPGVGS